MCICVCARACVRVFGGTLSLSRARALSLSLSLFHARSLALSLARSLARSLSTLSSALSRSLIYTHTSAQTHIHRHISCTNVLPSLLQYLAASRYNFLDPACKCVGRGGHRDSVWGGGGMDMTQGVKSNLHHLMGRSKGKRGVGERREG